MEYENDDRAYGGETLLSSIPDSQLPEAPAFTMNLVIRGGRPTNEETTDEPRGYDRDDDRDVRDIRDDRRADEDARARSASPDGRERMDTR